MENKVIIQGNVTEVFMLKKTGRMLDIFGVKVRKADGSEVTVECEAEELDKRLHSGTKIAISGSGPMWTRTVILRTGSWRKLSIIKQKRRC